MSCKSNNENLQSDGKGDGWNCDTAAISTGNCKTSDLNGNSVSSGEKVKPNIDCHQGESSSPIPQENNAGTSGTSLMDDFNEETKIRIRREVKEQILDSIKDWLGGYISDVVAAARSQKEAKKEEKDNPEFPEMS